MTRALMPVNQTAVGSARMLKVMGYRAPFEPGAPRVTFAHPAAPVAMAPAVVNQARLSASPVVVTAVVPHQPGRAMAFNVPGGITDAGTGSTVPGGTVPARG